MTESVVGTLANEREGRDAASLDSALLNSDPVGPTGVVSAAGQEAVDTIDAAPADVVGTVESPSVGSGMTDEQTDEVEEALRDVVDPELGVNIVDLGLVYDLQLTGEKLTIDMTLTSAACPLTDMIEDQINAALTGPDATTNLVKDYAINWVWLPPWGPEKITDDGREQMRALGFNI